MTASQVAREIGCGKSSVSRHVKNHLLPQAGAELEATPEPHDMDILGELTALYGQVKHHLARAEKADNWQAIRAFIAEARASLELLAKMLVVLRSELEEQKRKGERW